MVTSFPLEISEDKVSDLDFYIYAKPVRLHLLYEHIMDAWNKYNRVP